MSGVRTLVLTLVVLLAAVGTGVGIAGAVASDDVDTTQDNVTVTLVGDGDVDDGPATIAMFADELPPEFDTQYRNITAVNDTLIADTDVFVVYNVGAGANGTELIETVESDITTGAVYTDQWGSDSNGIPDRSAVLGDPADTNQDDNSGGDPPEWVVQQDHPIFDGVANASETVEIHTGSYADHTWFTGASAATIAEVDQGFGDPEGPAVAVDNDTESVLLSSIGVAFPDASEYTAAANQTFANAVEFAQPPELEGPYFQVSNLSAPAVAPAGGEINVSATVENIGNQSGTQTVEFVFNGSVVTNTTETLASDENRTVEFTSISLPDQVGVFEHGVQTANDSQTATISVEEPFFAVSDLSAPRTADTGATIDVNATVENTGNVAGEQTVEFRFNGTEVANTTVQLDAGGNTTVEFTPTLPGEEGFFEHGVFTADDNQTAEIGVGVEFTDVAVVDSAADGGDAPATVDLFEDDLSPGFTVEVVASADILSNNLTDEYDIFVVQGIDEDSVNATVLVNTIEDDVTTGAVYLDQAGFGDTYGITDRSEAIGAPGVTDDDTSGTAPAEYVIQADHPIFDGVGTVNDTVAITVDEDNRAWFSDAAGQTLAELGDQTGVDGAGVAVDPDSGAVLLSSIMVTSITESGELTAESGQILANAVEFAQPPDLEEPYFAVSGLSAPAVGEVGEEINVSATVENIGNQSGEQTVEFVFDGTEVLNTTVQLDSGANTTVEFSPTLPDEGGEFQHGISTANESQFASITVEAPFFEVSGLSAPREADTGAEINVSATITNTGNVSGTQEVEFRFDGSVVANTTETLNASENTTVEFSPTLPGQEGFFEHGVFTENDNQTAEIGVGVTFTDVAVVENTGGDGEPAQTVSMFESDLSLGFTVEIVSSADVLPNNLTDEYDVLAVQDIDEDSVNATVLVNTIENDTDTGVVYLDQANFGDTFGVTDRSDAIGEPGTTDEDTGGEVPVEYLIQADHPIFDGVGTAGNTVNLTVDEDNRAWFSNTTATVLADVGDQAGVSGAGVAVDAESQVVLLSSIMADSLDSPDEFTAAANQTLANAVEFVDPAEAGPNFLVSDLSAPAEAGAGTDINVSATVTNVGFGNGTQSVEFVFDGSVVANTTVELNAGENRTVEFTNISLPDASGVFEHGVFTDNDSQTANITVVQGSNFQVSSLDAPAEAVPGEEINVSATITNTGGEPDTQTVEFRFNGSVVANTTETLNASESTLVEFTDITLPNVEDTFEHGIFTEDSNQTATIEVRPEPVTVTVVEHGDAYGGVVQGLLQDGLPADGYEFQLRSADNVDSTVVAETDVFVFNSLNVTAGSDAEDSRERTDRTLRSSDSSVSGAVNTDTVELITGVEADATTGAVYLDNWGSDSNAIANRSTAIGDPAETFQAFDSNGDPIDYVIQEDHPLFDGVGGPGDTVTIHTEGFGDHTWFEGAAGDTLAEVQNQFDSGGPAATVDPDSGAVLLSSLGASGFVDDEDITDNGVQILANGVEVAEPPALSGDFFDVTELSAPAQANVSTTINVSATVTNVGNESGTQTVEFVFNGSVAASTTVELNATENTTVEFSGVQLPAEGGVFEHGVQTANDSQTAEITVGSPDIELVELVQPDELTLDGDIVTEMTIVNNGTAPYEGEVLQATNLNDTAPDSGAIAITANVTAVTLDPGENATFQDNLGTFAEINAALGTSFEAGDDVETGYWKGQNLNFQEDPEPTVEDIFSEEISIVEEPFFEVSDLSAPDEAAPGESINVSATVTNTGGLAANQTVEFQFDGQTVANTTVELNASASTTVEFSPTLPEQTGTFTHGVFTEDDNQTAEIAVVEMGPPNVTMSNLDIAGEGDDVTVIEGSYDVSAELSHADGPGGDLNVTLTVGDTELTQTVSLAVNETLTVTFEDATNGVDPGAYDVTMAGSNATVTGSLTVSVDVGGNNAPATDTNSDGLLDDIDGDESFDIFDVQALFNALESNAVQDNPELFNFNDDETPDEVTIFDVQGLFNQLN